jgi:hypothetical protein
MVHLLVEDGLRSGEKAKAAGAQTERRGKAGPGRNSLGGKTFPAALQGIIRVS